jgi:rRNA maturation protein Rpf1
VTVEILNRVAAFPKQLASTSRPACIRIASLASHLSRIHNTERA